MDRSPDDRAPDDRSPDDRSPDDRSPEDRFSALVDALAGEPGVTPPEPTGGRRFGASALQVHGSIFAMLRDGRLVVKLPSERVAALLADGTGAPFGAGRGRPMQEWVTVVTDDEQTWRALATEALAFVGAGGR